MNAEKKRSAGWIAAVCTFAAVQAAGCAIAWLGGYDFNDRNPSVALWAAMQTVIAAVMAGLAADTWSNWK